MHACFVRSHIWYSFCKRRWGSSCDQCLGWLHASLEFDYRVWIEPGRLSLLIHIISLCEAILDSYGPKGVRVAPVYLIRDTLFAGTQNGSVQSWSLDILPPVGSVLSAPFKSLPMVLTVCSSLVVCGTIAGAVHSVNITSGESVRYWDGETWARNIFRVGFSGEKRPVTVYLQGGTTHVAIF